jgi:transposase
MSLKLQAIGPIPKQTIEVAKAAFPKGNTYMKMRDEICVFFPEKAYKTVRNSGG